MTAAQQRAVANARPRASGERDRFSRARAAKRERWASTYYL